MSSWELRIFQRSWNSFLWTAFIVLSNKFELIWSFFIFFVFIFFIVNNDFYNVHWIRSNQRILYFLTIDRNYCIYCLIFYILYFFLSFFIVIGTIAIELFGILKESVLFGRIFDIQVMMICYILEFDNRMIYK